MSRSALVNTSSRILLAGAMASLCLSQPALAQGVNLALGKPTSATGSYSIYVPSRGNDGDPTTIWNGGAHEACWQVDLETPHAVQNIFVGSNQWGGGGVVTIFQLSHSLDGSTWTDVGPSFTGVGAGGLLEAFNVNTGGANMRHVRFCTLPGSTQWATLSELEIYGSAAVAVAPVITGPGGIAGAEATGISLRENRTTVTTFAASKAVTWSIDGGADAAKFVINPQTGALALKAPVDFENPSDADANNTYIVRIKATDADGLSATQTVTVTVTNEEEIAAKRNELDGLIRAGLRTYATRGLSDMLSFNESQVRATDQGCSAANGLRGSITPNGTGANANLAYSGDLGDCGGATRVIGDFGFARSRLGGGYNTRTFAGLRVEHQVSPDLALGLGVMASRANDALPGFVDSAIDDKSLQFKLYAQYRIAEKLRTAAFAGLGRTWYDFSLRDVSGFDLRGKMTGNRQFFGWMLSGDIDLGFTTLTTDAVLSRAVEKLGTARVDIQYLGESRRGDGLAVGTVDVTRLSVPVTAPIMLSGTKGSGAWSQLMLSPGLLCEDNDVTSSALQCGYQLGARFVAETGGRSRFHAEYRWESVSNLRRSFIGAGFALRFGDGGRAQVALDANQGVGGIAARDSRAMLTLSLVR